MGKCRRALHVEISVKKVDEIYRWESPMHNQDKNNRAQWETKEEKGRLEKHMATARCKGKSNFKIDIISLFIFLSTCSLSKVSLRKFFCRPTSLSQ